VRRLLVLLILLSVCLLCAEKTYSDELSGIADSLSRNSSQKKILDNGLIVILKEVPSSGLVSIDARVAAGSSYEAGLSGTGVSHFVEHLIFKGTNKRKPADVEKEIRSYGGTINAYTSHDYTGFVITVPHERLAPSLEALSDSMFNAIMHPGELERERMVIAKEIKMNRDDPARYTSRLMWSTMFRSHPYRHPVIGYSNLFMALKRGDILRYYKRMYVPNNMVLVLAGEFDPDAVMFAIEKYFGGIPRSSLNELTVSQEDPQTTKRALSIDEDLELSYFALGYRSVDLHDPDMPALDILSSVLGDGENSRLHDALYRKKKLVYSIGSWNYTPRDPGTFVISGLCSPEKLKDALNAISAEIDAIKEDGVAEEEVKRAKTMIATGYVYSIETLAGRARDLATNEITTGDRNFTASYIKAIDGVTEEDVRRVARAYLSNDSLTEIILSPDSGTDEKENREKRPEREIIKSTLPNGVKCLIMEDPNTPTVAMVAVALGGLRFEDEKTAGISNITGRMMLNGTKTKTEEKISKTIEGMGGGLSFFSGNNTVGVRANVLKKDVDAALELFSDIVVNPAFPEDILEREKATITAAINSVDDDIFGSGIKLFKETLYGNHPYGFQSIGTVASVEGFKREDLARFHGEHFKTGNITLAVYGDVDAAHVEAELAKHFAGLPDGDAPQLPKIAKALNSGVKYNFKELEKDQSLIIMGFKGTTIKDKDRYVLQAISTALSGISGRLAMRLRERLGIAYSVGAFTVPALDPGYFALYISTTKKNIELSKKEFLSQIKQLNKSGLRPEELAAIKSELIGNQRISLQTNNSLAHHTSLDEVYGLGYNHYKEYSDTINSITVEDTVRVARKYLTPNTYTLVVIEGERIE